MERLPTAKFPEPVLWLQRGDEQLHLFDGGRDAPTPRPRRRSTSTTSTRVYAKAKEMGILDSSAFGSPLRTIRPAGCSSTCATRPATCSRSTGPDASTLSPETLADAQELGEPGGRRGGATLYHRLARLKAA